MLGSNGIECFTEGRMLRVASWQGCHRKNTYRERATFGRITRMQPKKTSREAVRQFTAVKEVAAQSAERAPVNFIVSF